MAKRKADNLAQAPPANGSKKAKHNTTTENIKPSLLDDSDSASSSDDDSVGGAKLEQPDFKINEEYAKRFEHNKKREELHKLEEKYQKPAKPTNGPYGDKYDEDSSSSDDEDEDDEGFLATEALDAEISATLQAIRSKDPRVYDEKVTFYAPIEVGDNEVAAPEKKDKPMYLSDYHRENLLQGHTGADEEEEKAPRTFAEEQEHLKKSIVQEMHAAAEESPDEDDEDGGFLIPKSKPPFSVQGIHPSRASKVKVDLDAATAEKDPETFLSNFMAARAWVPSDGARFQPLESDDEEEDERAEKFEAAYNLRFEDPKGSNEMLKSYARDVVAAKTVRREEASGRKKQRDTQREKREAERAEREEERARLRRLKIEEMEGKLQKIKKAAGLRGKTLKDEEWTKFLDDGWDDEQWEAEMNKRFGDDYYAEQEASSNNSDADSDVGGSKKKKVKKPKWDDDIDIKDLIPEFEEEEESQKQPAFTLSDSEDDDEDENEKAPEKSKTNKDRQQERQAKKKAARLERKKIEDLVDSKMELDVPTKSKQPTKFRYRETSPTSFGLTTADILMAPDTSLNQFAGLKKMASFRDPDKKRKDKKHLGKKARLRQWRKETFGNENGPEIVINTDATEGNDAGGGVNIVNGGRKKKRSRKSKNPAAAQGGKRAERSW
ncbi:Krr1-domain-containing protein [Stipitochalara longipes BDJ]|nr:Krr1-domain-containing protein [Stipitochalara longipes BDJ]